MHFIGSHTQSRLCMDKYMYLSSVLLPETSTFPPMYLCYSIICPEDTGAVPVEFHMKYSLDRSSRATKKGRENILELQKTRLQETF